MFGPTCLAFPLSFSPNPWDLRNFKEMKDDRYDAVDLDGLGSPHGCEHKP